MYRASPQRSSSIPAQNRRNTPVTRVRINFQLLRPYLTVGEIVGVSTLSVSTPGSVYGPERLLGLFGMPDAIERPIRVGQQRRITPKMCMCGHCSRRVVGEGQNLTVTFDEPVLEISTTQDQHLEFCDDPCKRDWIDNLIGVDGSIELASASRKQA